MQAIVLIFFLLQPDGSMQMRTTHQTYQGGEQCVTDQMALMEDLNQQKQMGTLKDFSSVCIDTGIVPGVPA